MKPEALADASKSEVVKTQARGKKAVATAESNVRAEVAAAAKKAQQKTNQVKKTALKEVAVVKKGVRSTAAKV